MCSTCPSRFSVDVLESGKDIFLPYYRDINSYLPSPVARSNYTPYHLFCLKKNIMPLIREINDKYDIAFPSKKHMDIMIITIQIYESGFPITPDNETYTLIRENLQSYIDLYPYCLLYRREYLGNKYNDVWLDDMLPYVSSDIGMYNNGDIFVNLESVADHSGEWDRLYFRLENTLDRYYNDGVLYRPDKHLIDNWNLKRYKGDLYIANWSYRFTHDKIEFLYSKDKRIVLYIGPTDKIRVIDGWLTLTVESYGEVVDLIEHII